MSIVKQGWLEKCGPKWSPTWNKRWVVLYDSKVMEYFTSSGKSELKGLIELSGSEAVSECTDKGKSFKMGFQIVTKGRTYKMAATSDGERKEWIRQIELTLSGKRRRTRFKKAMSQRGADLVSAEAMATLKKEAIASGSLSPASASASSGPRSLATSTPERAAVKKRTAALRKLDSAVSKTTHSATVTAVTGDSRTPPRKKRTASAGDSLSHGRALSHFSGAKGFDIDDLKSSASDALAIVADDLEQAPASLRLNIADSDKLTPQIIGHISSFLETKEQPLLWQVSKSWRFKWIESFDPNTFWQYYSFKPLPLVALEKYESRRNPKQPWVFAHEYHEVWVFGQTDFKYKAGDFADSADSETALSSIPVVSFVRRLFLDDFMLWTPEESAVKSIISFVESVRSSINELTLRAYVPNPSWISAMPQLNHVFSLTLLNSFHTDLFVKNVIILSKLKHLAMRRVDLIAAETVTAEDGGGDEDGGGGVSKKSSSAPASATMVARIFSCMTRLVALNLSESRWRHSIVIPPQVKFIRFVPADFSVMDLSRLCDDDEALKHQLEYELNYACDVVLNHRNWPSVLNGAILHGHDALQGRRLRVWVLKKKKKWDKQVMNVNYCTLPPPLQLFERNNCYKDCLKVDGVTDAAGLWEAKGTKTLRSWY